MGNPHAIIFVPFLDPVDLKSVGPKFETHPVFPKKTNVEFVQVNQPPTHPPTHQPMYNILARNHPPTHPLSR